MHWLEAVLVTTALLAFVDRLVSRRAAVLTLLVLVTLPLPTARIGNALSAGPFTAVVPRIAYVLAPWAGLVPFALVLGRSRARDALRLVVVTALALETLLPSSAPLVTATIAGVLGALLDEIDGREADAMLALGVVVVGAIVAHDRPGLRWPVTVATGTTGLALVLPRAWLPFRRSSAIAVAATGAGIFLRVRGG